MSEKPVRSPRELLIAGLLCAAMGAMVVLVASGIVPSSGISGTPAWASVCGGLLFVLAGGALVLRWFAGGSSEDGEIPESAPRWSRAIYYLAGLICIGALAVIGTWIGFGPGERSFSISIPFLGKGANELIGRSAFGAGALLTWLFFFAAAISWWRKLVDRNDAASP
jgi:hypothetical protein